MILWETVLIGIMAWLIALETERFKPKPHAVGNGDTLMVRIAGYDFRPKYCDVDHFHVGHKENYNCEEDVCKHIIYEDKLD